jgi:hypothetical protein
MGSVGWNATSFTEPLCPGRAYSTSRESAFASNNSSSGKQQTLSLDHMSMTASALLRCTMLQRLHTCAHSPTHLHPIRTRPYQHCQQ